MSGSWTGVEQYASPPSERRARKAMEAWDRMLMSILRPKLEAAVKTGFGIVVIQPRAGDLLGVEVYPASPITPGTVLLVNPNRKYYESGPPNRRISFYTQ